MKKYPSLFFFLLLSSCASLPEQHYYYNEIVVRNNSRSVLQNVEIKAHKTHRIFQCSNVAPHASCSNSFTKRKYQHSPITISWITQDQRRAKKEFILEVPESMDKSKSLRGVLEIKSDGGIASYFEQD